jgi:hypothetical protein
LRGSIILLLSLSLFGSKINIPEPEIIEYPYIEKLLDSLRIEESSNGKYLLNINYKNGKEVSRDEGPYQFNSKYHIYFVEKYNEGKEFNPYNEIEARYIAKQILLHNYSLCSNWFDSLVIYNTGYNNWLKYNISYKTFTFAERILRRIK